jgi:hypothetical protein
MICRYCHMHGTIKEVNAHMDLIHKTEMYQLEQ